MHRWLMAAPSDMQVDHINGDRLDNRRCNLRLATHAENQRNRGAQKNNRSGYKGVCWHGSAKKWRAGIGGRSKHLGVFDSPEEAYAAYCAAAKILHGEYARTA